MRAKRSTFLVGLALAFAVLQCFRPAKNQSSPTPFAGKDDVTALYPPSPEVRRILATACYDCHSNHTRYPWYAEIQPVAWWLARHVDEGRRELNFSEFGAYGTSRRMKKLEALCDEVADRTMPLKSYRFIHRDARLSDAQVTALTRWSEAAQDQSAGQ